MFLARSTKAYQNASGWNLKNKKREGVQESGIALRQELRQHPQDDARHGEEPDGNATDRGSQHEQMLVIVAGPTTT